MSHEQLYYPNLRPRITPKLALSLLHWDRVVRIFPKKGTAYFRPEQGVIRNLEKERILVREPLSFIDIENATTWFERLIRIAQDRQSSQRSVIESLIRPLPRLSSLERSDYYIYRGKANRPLSTTYPDYFRAGSDPDGNEVLFCSKETGLTYMTFLAYFLCKRRNYANTITDQVDAFPLFIVLNRLLHFSSGQHSVDFVPMVEAARQIEKIFFIPLYRVLEPANFMEEKTIEKILSFRKDATNEQLRKNYLRRIDLLLSDLNRCCNDTEAKEVGNKHAQDFQNDLRVLIAACKAYGIPVNKKIVSHGRMNGWETAGRVWDATSRVTGIVTTNVLAIIKPLLKLKPSVDFYNRILKKKDDFYPLLIQETFAPTYMQRLFSRVRQLDEIEISPR